ncbi:hypothetical protein [Falsiroseomonas sp.]|uniref:hypothetical protein n=1 Tax=Falsiroseomonas sp. TaxID=2870721 RepID=UPI003563555F
MSILIAAALLAGCAANIAPVAQAPPIEATAVAQLPPEPAPPPGITLVERIRQEAWITRFWEQLNAAQRRRVTKQLRNNVPRLAADEAEAAPIWDALGLPERDALVFGPGLRGFRPAPTPAREAAIWSRGSSPAPGWSAPR